MTQRPCKHCGELLTFRAWADSRLPLAWRDAKGNTSTYPAHVPGEHTHEPENGCECATTKHPRYGDPVPPEILSRSYADHRDDCPVYISGHLKMIIASRNFHRANGDEVDPQ